MCLCFLFFPLFYSLTYYFLFLATLNASLLVFFFLENGIVVLKLKTAPSQLNTLFKCDLPSCFLVSFCQCQSYLGVYIHI